MKFATPLLIALCTVAACQPAADTEAESPPPAVDVESKRDAAIEAARRSLPSDKCQELEGFEALACADPELARMDDELTALVARLVAHSDHSAQADVRAKQAQWQREVRGPCLELGPPKRQQCLAAAYTTRMNEVRDAL